MIIFRCEKKLCLASIGALSLASCGQPEVKACEQFIKSGLKAPSTYKRLALSVHDERVTWEQHLRESPNDRNVEIFRKAYEHGQLRRIVALDYEASNAFGVPIRSSEQCAFGLQEGKVADRTRLLNSVKIAEAQRSFRQVNEAGALPNGVQLDMPEPTYPCCE